MLRTRLYYTAKPFLPRKLRLTLRRWRAKRILRRCGDTWPILESAGRKPDGWPGWPDGKQFAFVLTHDVESKVGLERVKPLAELEMRLGFRSAFYFIPEGPYTIPPKLLQWLTQNGFEVGVHDLRHDGKLFRSRELFRKHAARINHYLREWDAVGFRAGFMLHNLDWFHDLEIEYDASTFDTDPFEPQPDGVGTIFPFVVQRSDFGAQISELRNHKPVLTADRCPLTSGYVELPYTLPQDFTLGCLLRDSAMTVWERKLQWIAKAGGMAMVIVHPDYLMLGDALRANAEVGADVYARWLRRVRDDYGGVSWNVLPHEVATHIRAHRSTYRAGLRPDQEPGGRWQPQDASRRAATMAVRAF